MEEEYKPMGRGRGGPAVRPRATDAEDEPLGPRERLRLWGAPALSDAELLAVLLGTGTTAEPVQVLAARVLMESGGLTELGRMGAGELQRRAGIGPTKAGRICAAVELGVRFLSRPLHPDRPIRCSRDVDRALRSRLQDDRREHFFALALDARNRPATLVEVAVGGLSQCAFTPADAFRGVLRASAAAVVFVHNHPSGEAEPSPEDKAMTERLVQVGDLLGIRVLDHIIVATGGYFSFLDAGLLAKPDPTGGWAVASAATVTRDKRSL